MSRRIKNIIAVVFSLIRFSLLKIIHGNRFCFKGIQRFSPQTQLFFLNKGKILLGNKVRVHTGTKIRAISGGVVEIGTNATFNYNCMIVALKNIKIGAGVEFGPNVLVYDHDHDFRAKGGLKANKYKYGSVEIGDNSWVGANTIILRGTKLGKNCVVGAGCVISGEFPDNSIITQKRETTVRSV
ncbi:succinyltransferase-like protein [Mesonia algae]|uniref:Succinyltransferase-like protein n=1 Tax=Mesonia algae TaxID=213248 RepID=A0A2W7IBL5_9FLAO|nr:succinyltransferase-like protein [Mesonia algae]